MKITMISFKIASWNLLLGGIIHSVTDLLSPKTAKQIEYTNRMKEFTGQALGTEFNVFSFFQGFSLMMGLFLIGYGALNLLILKNNQQAQLPSNILILNIIISLVSVILSIKYFFIIPTILVGIPLLGFSISYLTKIRQE